MIKCPVCYGRGRVPVNFYGEQTQTTNCCEPTCKSCNGTGIVMEYQPLNNDLQDRLDQANKVIQEQQERIKELENNNNFLQTVRDSQSVLLKDKHDKLQDLQQKLDKAVEIIKDFCDMSFDEHPDCKYQRAEEFLATVEGNNETN
jgi:predicted nuclease with TOPRIM domain